MAKAPALIWEVKKGQKGVPHLQRKAPGPYVNHYHFPIEPDWGHITITMSSPPPFGIQIMLNGHEGVERQAPQQTIATPKAGNCFWGGSFPALDPLADTLPEEHAIGHVAKVGDRWVYTRGLCFVLDTQEQQRSPFRYPYSAYQLELSRNLVFTRGTDLDPNGT